VSTALRNLACSKARYISALEWPVRLNRETMAGIAARVRRRGGGAGSGFAAESGEECGLVVFVSEGDAAALDCDGSCSAYNLSSSSLASGTIAP
jgi:hypothetical protein